MSIWFPDDNNYILQKVQIENKSAMIGFLFEHPANRYLWASRLLETETELSILVKDSLNSRIFIKNLIPVYDLLSAYYRFSINPSGQLPLFNEGRPIEEIYCEDWSFFYYPEVKKISEDERCAVNLIKSVVFFGEDSGLRAREDLLKRLEQKYPMVRRRELLPDLLIQQLLQEEEEKKFSKPTRSY